jgi:hypothetical protein
MRVCKFHVIIITKFYIYSTAYLNALYFYTFSRNIFPPMLLQKRQVSVKLGLSIHEKCGKCAV